MQLLPTHRVEKIWGRKPLPAPFADCASGKIGEIWFEPPPELPDLLVKYIFTTEKLSVQVHPNDEQAPAGVRGKEECWYIVNAEPNAHLAIGLREEVTEDALCSAAREGSIETMLEYYPVSRGDFFYLPAGTIHAIGPGISLIEIQQNSDVTYRLYDYGRPRELHLDDALRVAIRQPYAPKWRCKVPSTGTVRLVDGPHFELHRTEGTLSSLNCGHQDGPLLLIPLHGKFAYNGVAITPGDCALIVDTAQVSCEAQSQALIVRAC